MEEQDYLEPLTETSARNSFADRLLKENDSTTTRKSSRSPRCRRCLICVAALVVFIAIFIPLSLFVIGPAVAQNTINQAAVTLLNATMHSPTNDSVIMSTFLEMSAPNGNFFSAEVAAEEVSIGTPSAAFGRMYMSQISIHSSNLYLNISSRLVVTDVESFTAATAGVLQGRPEPWMIRGSPKVHVKLLGVKLTYNLKMEKTFDLPKTLFIRMESSDVVIRSSNVTTVVATASASFFSSSVLELLDMGLLTFNLTDSEGVVIGFVDVPNFVAKRDYNYMDCSVTAQSLPDASNNAAINRFFTKFSSGEDQIAVMRGPIRSISPFLSNIVTQNVTIKGQHAVSNLRADNMRIVSCSDSGIVSTSVASLFSGLNLEVAALQVGGEPVILEILSNGVHVGTSVLDHDLVIGFNEFPLSATLAAISPDDIPAIRQVLKKFSNGESQTLTVRGPFNHPNPFMNNILESSLVLNGAKAVDGASASGFKILASNATHLQTTCRIEFSSQFPIRMSAVGGSLTFELRNSDGIFLGTSIVASDIVIGMNIVPEATTYMFLDATGSNVDALHTFMKSMTSGTDQKLSMTGPVGSASILLDYSMSANVTIAGFLLLENLVTYNIAPASGTVDTLLSTATSSFTTGAAVAKGALGGAVVFGLRTVDGIELGSCAMDVQLVPGINIVDHTASIVKSETNADAINTFNSLFLSQRDQTMVVYGPLGTATPFLANIFEGTVTLKGVAVKMVSSALVDSLSLGGYSVTVDGSSKTIRGTKLMVTNPFPATVKQSNMVFNVDLHEPIAYTFSNTGFGTHECPTTTAFAQQITEKGMYLDTPDVDYVTMAEGLTSFFSPSQPQPSQSVQEICRAFRIVSILPCCFLSAVPAAACRAVNTHKEHFIRLRTEGNVTVTVGDFVSNVHFVQEDTPLMFDEDVTTGFLQDLEMNCKDFTFH